MDRREEKSECRAGVNPRPSARPGSCGSAGRKAPPYILALLLFACSDNDREDDILIAADPPSLDKGQTVNVELIASGTFFDKAVTKPVKSEGGLVMEVLRPKHAKQAVATFASDKETQVGIHTFDLSSRGIDATVTLSVLAPDRGPGTVTAERNVGSSGAEFAFFVINGEGTDFDSRCEVEVEGADGFHVRFLDVENPRRVEVFYEIDLDQEPTEATITLVDGDYRYEVPFIIVEHKVFDNMMEDLVIEKGRVGEAVLYNPAANLLMSTAFDVEDDAIETGDTTIGPDDEAIIPIRVPFDYEEDKLTLQSKTFLEGGAFLELMNTEIRLEEPAYIAVHGAKMNQVPGEEEHVFFVHGEDAEFIENLEVEDDTETLMIVDWRAESENMGSFQIYQSEEVEEGAFTLTAEARGRKIKSVLVVSSWESRRAHVPAMIIAAGDHLYVPITVQGGDLVEDEVSAVSSTDDVEVMGVTYVDEFTAVLELKVDEHAYPGTKRMTLEGEKYDYPVSIETVESGF